MKNLDVAVFWDFVSWRQPPGALYKYWAQGLRPWFGRGQLGMPKGNAAEVRWCTCAVSKSRSVRVQHVRSRCRGRLAPDPWGATRTRSGVHNGSAGMWRHAVSAQVLSRPSASASGMWRRWGLRARVEVSLVRLRSSVARWNCGARRSALFGGTLFLFLTRCDGHDPECPFQDFARLRLGSKGVDPNSPVASSFGPRCARWNFSYCVEELKLQLLNDWQQALTEGSGNRYVSLVWRYLRCSDGSIATMFVDIDDCKEQWCVKGHFFLDDAFDVARVFRVNVRIEGDVLDATETTWLNPWRNSSVQKRKLLLSSYTKFVAIVRSGLRLPHANEAFFWTRRQWVSRL